jgi:hypothetical protein
LREIVTALQIISFISIKQGAFVVKLRGLDFTHSFYTLKSLVPDGRIFGQITQKRPQKIVHGREKLEAVKLQNLAKSGRKEAEKLCHNYLDEKPYIYL